MLRSLSLRNKLLLAVGLPMVLLALAAGATMRGSQTDAQQATEQASRVQADLDILVLGQTLRAEHAAGLTGNQERLDSTRAATDASFAEAIGSTRQSALLLTEIQADLDQIRRGLGNSASAILATSAADEARTGNSVSPSAQLQEDFVDLAFRPQIFVEGDADTYRTGDTAAKVSAVAELIRWEGALLDELALVSLILEQPGQPSSEQRLRLLEAAVTTEQAEAGALAVSLKDFDMSSVTESDTGQKLIEYRTAVRNNQTIELASQTTAEIASSLDEQIQVVSAEKNILIDQLNEENSQALVDTNRRQRNVLLAALAVVAGMGSILFALYRAITAPIMQLSTRGREVFQQELPSLIDKIRSGDAKAGDQEITPLTAETDDELGELVNVFNDLHTTTVTMAAEQAQSRKNASEMFVNLGRRNQRILDTVLRDLDVLEHDEQNPTRLSQLYLVDQKVTRMRRNAESLLVLAGTQTPRQWAKPAPLGDVVRAAMSEVENFERVDSTVDNSVLVPGNAVADLTHLLAELIENALRFSPPEESVLVHSKVVDGHTQVVVTDRGFGIKEEKRLAANEQIIEAAHTEETPSKHLGLYVVGRLATRHGIVVTLDTEEGQPGLSANVNLAGLAASQPKAKAVPAPVPEQTTEVPVITTAVPTSTATETVAEAAVTEPTTENPPDEKSSNEEQQAEEATSDKPTSDKPTSDKPTSDKPTSDKPTSDKPTSEESMPEIAPAIPRSEEVSSHAEREGGAGKPPATTIEEPPVSRAQPNFEEMTKPRAPKRRVPGASLPANLKKTPVTATPATTEPEADQKRAGFDAGQVRDAFSGFQKSASPSTTKPAPKQKSKPAAKPKKASAKAAPKTKPKAERRSQPDFAEMTKPRAPKRRVPGASLPDNLKKTPVTAAPAEPATSKPEDVRDAFSGFQKSTSPSTTKPVPMRKAKPAAKPKTASAKATAKTKPEAERRSQPDFAEMTKPRAPKRRVPGASLPDNLKKTPVTPTPTATEPEADKKRAGFDAGQVRDAFSGFQKSASKSSTTSDKTESDDS